MNEEQQKALAAAIEELRLLHNKLCAAFLDSEYCRTVPEPIFAAYKQTLRFAEEHISIPVN